MNTQETEIIARDQSAAEYEKYYVQEKGKYHNVIEINTVLSYLQPQATDIFLDAGCGTGRITRILAKACRKVYAFDFSSKSLEVLAEQAKKESLDNIVYVTGNLAQEFSLDEKVNKAVSVQVIQHIPSESGRNMAVKNVSNSLQKGGTFVMLAYNWNDGMKNKGMKKEGTFDRGIYYYRFTPDELITLFENCGFEKIVVVGCINLGIYWRFGDKKLFNIFLFPIMILDTLISKFKISTRLGWYLICTGTKR